MPERPTAVELVELSGGVQFEIPSDASYVSLARMVVSSLAYGCRDLSEERIEDLVLAVSEACTNAIEAHAEADRSHPVVIRWQQDADACRVEIIDRGTGIDVGALPPAGAVADPGRAALEGGLGVSLIRALVDDVSFESDARGTAVSMAVFPGVDPAGDDNGDGGPAGNGSRP